MRTRFRAQSAEGRGQKLPRPTADPRPSTASSFSCALRSALCVLLLALPALAQDDRFELKFGKDLPFRGGRVTIDHGFGDLVVRSGPGDEVQVRATIRSSDDEVGKQIRIHAAEGADGVSIRTEYPTVKRFIGKISYSVDMTVTVPSSASVTARNRFGNVDVRGLASSIVEARQGSVKFQEGRGTQSIATSFGSVEVTGNQGDMKVTTSNGSMTVRNVDGSLDATNRFGSVDVADVKQAATINTANGSVQVADVGGALKVINRFAGVTASAIGGPADITTSNGRVSLSNVRSSATVRNSFGTVTVDDVAGDLVVDGSNSKVEAKGIKGKAKVDTGFGGVKLTGVGGAVEVTSSNGNINVSDVGAGLTAETTFGAIHAERVKGPASVKGANGSVTLSEIAGNVRVRTTFGSVFLDGVGGAVDAGSSNGSISLRGLRGTGCQPVSMQTSFGSMRLALGEPAAYDVNARTSFGRINTAFPITTTTVSSEAVNGTIGKGGCRMDLVNANGNITIERE